MESDNLAFKEKGEINQIKSTNKLKNIQKNIHQLK